MSLLSWDHCEKSLTLSSWERDKTYTRQIWLLVVQSLSRVWLFVTLWTVTRQALLSMGFLRHEYRSGLPFPSPRDLPDPGIRFASPKSGYYWTKTIFIRKVRLNVSRKNIFKKKMLLKNKSKQMNPSRKDSLEPRVKKELKVTNKLFSTSSWSRTLGQTIRESVSGWG